MNPMDLLVGFERFDSILAALILRVEFDVLTVVLQRELFLSGLFVGFAEAVVDVRGLWIFLGIELQDLDGLSDAISAEQGVAEAIEARLGKIVESGRGALEFAILRDGSIDAAFVDGAA